MLALGCKSSHILVADCATMGIVRYFSLTEDCSLESNEDVDQFHHFQRMMHTLEDDFTFKQKFSDWGAKESEAFLT